MRIPALTLSTLALAGALVACSRPEPPAEPLRAVRTQTVGLGSSTATSEYAGEVRARVESRLGFRVGGKLLKRSVELGEAVKAGQLLAQLDAADLQLGQEAAQAVLRAAQANAEQARADLARARELFGQNFVGAAEVERRETALKAAQGSLDQARAQAGVQGHQAEYARLVADASGVITAVEAEPGMVVGAGTPVLRLAHDGPRDVVFGVPEDRLAQLRALRGKPGALKVSLWGGAAGTQPELVATVREVAAAADPATRTFLVKADLGGADVRLGQTATVRLAGASRDDVVHLPLAAVFEQAGRSTVWLLDAATMTVQAQPVTVAGAEGRQVLVSGGLAAGQEVVTAGVHALTQGQKVKRYLEPKVQPKGDAPAAPAQTAAAAASAQRR
ncbi:MAG TPA: efflux RND transporter periplasmic adaptor subunit [Burkholderiaceae bacterium]|nr:efflux RND transporter periplasmic adaptor subunit [Burkholderiaceae bacterium]HNG80424.1 efflux RND transporter periplasmic adaptor subunit [Burkholderiaceae bacterium]